eukprot:UN02142
MSFWYLMQMVVLVFLSCVFFVFLPFCLSRFSPSNTDFSALASPQPTPSSGKGSSVYYVIGKIALP